MHTKTKLFGRIAAAVLSTALAGNVMGFIPENRAGADLTISVSPYASSQINNGVFEGWGTSLCWWANRIGYSDTLSEKAAELFFGDSGLRMNIARYNIGGGDNPSHNHITRTDSNMPGYTVYNNGNVTYDWTADARQRNVLLKAIEAYGDDFIVEMFSNSPPYYMTKSGCSTGNNDAWDNNLKDDCYDDFAEYLAEVCMHYENEWGVKVQSIDPMNEPYTDYWGANSKKQEGCHFDIGTSQSTIITELQKSMEKRGLGDVILCGTDESSIDTQIQAYNALSSDAKKALDRIDTHTYSGSKRTELNQLALSAGKNLWMSEVDGSGTAGSNAGQMGAGLWLAQRMVTDCNGLNPAAWILWQTIDNHISSTGFEGKKDSGMPNISGGFWGLAVADHDKNDIILTKKYYSFGQFSRYIRPGFTLLSSSGSTLAAYDKENGRLVIVAVNTAGSNTETVFDLSQFSRVGSSVQVVRTSGSTMENGENWAELAPLTASRDGFRASLLANSVTTFIIDDVASADIDASEIKLSPDMITGSAPWNDTDNDCKKAIDGDISTFFDGVGNGWVQIDLGNAYSLDLIAFAPRAGYEARCVDGYFTVSSDGANWHPLHTITAVPSAGLNYIGNLESAAECRYIRYQVPDGKPDNGVNSDSVYCCNIAEIKLYGKRSGMMPSQPALIELKQHILGTKLIDGSRIPLSDSNSDSSVDIKDYAIQLRNRLKMS